VDGLLADLGVASPHLDDPARGFSFKLAGPLDMRMDPSRTSTAAQIVNTMSQGDMAKAFWEMGDEEDAEKIAALIVEEREIEPIETTDRLNEIICQARDFTLKRAEGAKLHPSTRTFQVLRMLVNREIPNLLRLLDVLPRILKPGGVAAIISFHSGEDRLVKHAFKEGLKAGLYDDVANEPIIAKEMEIRRNGRSRSAKLRWARV
jgi:16S rRNA (cytosine1402-N4)-methyltransferase